MRYIQRVLISRLAATSAKLRFRDTTPSIWIVDRTRIATLAQGSIPQVVGRKKIGAKVPQIATSQSNGMGETVFGSLRKTYRAAVNVSEKKNKRSAHSYVF